MENKNLKSIVESLLFAGGEEISLAKLAGTAKCKKSEALRAAEELKKEYVEANRGIRILMQGEKICMAAAAENGEYIHSFIQGDISEDLSKACLETLAIIAYRGPIGRAELEEIRGVNCSFVLRKLLMRGLVDKVDNSRDARIYLYQASFDLLKKLGIEKAEDLPNYAELAAKEILKQPCSA